MACQWRKECQGDIRLATERGSSCSYDGKSSNCPAPWSPGRSTWSCCQRHVASIRCVSAFPLGAAKTHWLRKSRGKFYRLVESQFVSNEVMFQVWLDPGAQTKSSPILFSLFPVPPSHSFTAFYWLHSGWVHFPHGGH